MSSSIHPCLWFDQQAAEAADFYISVFPNSRIVDKNPIAVSFEVMGTLMMGLNGGPKYQQTQACSYFVYCGEEVSIEEVYDSLKKDGKVYFPLDTYPWSPKYAWVQDRFGTNWQLDADPIRSVQKIVPCLLFVNEKKSKVREAREFYTHIFPNSIRLMEAPLPDSEDLLFTQFKLDGYIMNAMSSPERHEFDFSPGNSLVITCKGQAEIDYYWEKLGESGEHGRCGWLTDKFGLSWQVVPEGLGKMMSDPEKGKRSMEALLKMNKLIIETLKNP
ncbi:putative 3-demethylubiquinone-9 3-methyltransferase (glyoxalase superfamily) [Algoriphagus boseongensis]|uniref:Putative 3-demethylubiquinone-9 3-methyltransferase (Glyoxalase superfamily) n=1 Tax=Algoriphagus boseongensis TaxID=1442587 RepID=A0A4R6T6C2_9BACT|nr:VOC family protein [Algoriphagus boseongensis]TDQ17222.1 putative 3-demethylubiquinone-9 3-methyltransferase (glyoxalase superfamily) [Algoriphagus boseongensis]